MMTTAGAKISPFDAAKETVQANVSGWVVSRPHAVHRLGPRCPSKRTYISIRLDDLRSENGQQHNWELLSSLVDCSAWTLRRDGPGAKCQQCRCQMNVKAFSNVTTHWLPRILAIGRSASSRTVRAAGPHRVPSPVIVRIDDRCGVGPDLSYRCSRDRKPSVRVCMKLTSASSSASERPSRPMRFVFMLSVDSGAGQHVVPSPGSLAWQRGSTSRVL